RAVGHVGQPERAVRPVWITQQVRFELAAVWPNLSCIDERDRDSEHLPADDRRITAENRRRRLKLRARFDARGSSVEDRKSQRNGKTHRVRNAKTSHGKPPARTRTKGASAMRDRA